MPDRLLTSFSLAAWWSYGLRMILFFALAWGVHRMAGWLAGRIVNLSHLTANGQRARQERLVTMHGLIAGCISFVAFGLATLASAGMFVSLNTLIWVVGLFSAAFGLGARPVISDVLTGVTLIFDDPFAVGEKVEILDMEGRRRGGQPAHHAPARPHR
jgi:small-conductance mechanosensitive channel